MEKKRSKITVAVLFAVYVGWMSTILPLRTIRDYFLVMRMRNPWESGLRAYGWVNFLGNILAFVPLGLFLPLLFRRQRNVWLFLVTVVLAVCGVELLQFWTRKRKITGTLPEKRTRDCSLCFIPAACRRRSIPAPGRRGTAPPDSARWRCWGCPRRGRRW